MKLSNISLALLLGIGALTSCSEKLELTNPNQQTTATFGNTVADLEESIIACYNHIRMEGTYARVGYNIDVCRGDEVWNSSQVWYMPFDDLNEPITDEIGQWSWRDWYYTINVCNYVLSRVGQDYLGVPEQLQRIAGQALFLRGLAYYNLCGYYQNPALIVDYESYSTLEGLYASNAVEGDQDPNDQYDRVMDQVEQDFERAIALLPSKEVGGEWAKGRATSGAAAGFYARALMMRHKYNEALAVLKEIIAGTYGKYELMKNYGDNFREGPAYENNAESLFEVQFLDYGSQGTDDEWTPVNTSPNATQGHAIESNFGPGDCGGWADLSASPWLYQLFKKERTTDNSLDPRLYWTIGTYEPEWEGFEYGNVCYTQPMTADAPVVTNNNYGGLPIAKNTNLRTGIYDKVVTGLHCGINLRLMRYSDVLLRAAECENEISGPTQQAIDWINQVRRRANLNDLALADFNNNADKLFEQIANVERPKEFGCETGRGFDLIRWGWFYNSDRLKQLKAHAVVLRSNDKSTVKNAVDYSSLKKDESTGKLLKEETDRGYKTSFDEWIQGHEFLPIYQGTLNNNPNLVGNSANFSLNNASYFTNKRWTVHPVVDL
ncbi:MAG: RagB/SusD family nutrient uptake outer membrane protein [Prevotella sp.]|nr:RagB/SusD family nutrient uptake outer membrane protein [Prevotella sp.]